jgi:hypothetical protein
VRHEPTIIDAIETAVRKVEPVDGIRVAIDGEFFVATDDETHRQIAKSRSLEGLKKNIAAFRKKVGEAEKKFEPFEAMIQESGGSNWKLIPVKVTSRVHGETHRYDRSSRIATYRATAEGSSRQVRSDELYRHDGEILARYDAAKREFDAAKKKFSEFADRLSRELRHIADAIAQEPLVPAQEDGA